MAALELDKLTWPEIQAELEAGRDTVVIAFGATEQHGLHVPLATDALLGDELARAVTDRLDALVAPTVRAGCSSHHLGFPGTLSLEDETFHAIVRDLVRSLGARRLRPGRAAADARRQLRAAGGGAREAGGGRRRGGHGSDGPRCLLRIASVGEEEHGVPLGEGGVHAGEWETSMLLSLHPELVNKDRAEAGYTGDCRRGSHGRSRAAPRPFPRTGAIGDPGKSSAEHGRRYWETAIEIALEQIGPE